MPQYAYTSFGELLGWLIGWNLTLEYAIGAAAVARSWSDYFTSMINDFGGSVPHWLHNWDIGVVSDASPFAALIIGVCTFVMMFGVKESAKFNSVVTGACRVVPLHRSSHARGAAGSSDSSCSMHALTGYRPRWRDMCCVSAVLNVLILVFVIILGATKVSTDNYTCKNHSFAPYGGAKVISAAGTIFFSYLGFDMVSSMAEEVANPQRDLPIGIIGSLGIAGVRRRLHF